MTNKLPSGAGGKVAIAGAIGSAAIAAAMLYASRRKQKSDKPKEPPILPGGEKIETD